MANIVIARGPWTINTALITSTTRLSNGNVNVVANGVGYELTVAEAITLSVSIPQIPPTIPDSFAGSLFPNTNIGVLGVAADGRLVIIAFGVAASDAAIVAQVGVDALYADGSVYFSVLATGGGLWQKQNDVWVLNGVA